MVFLHRLKCGLERAGGAEFRVSSEELHQFVCWIRGRMVRFQINIPARRLVCSSLSKTDEFPLAYEADGQVELQHPGDQRRIARILEGTNRTLKR